MINEKQEDRPLIYDFSKPLHVKYLNETINRITQYIFYSKVYSSYAKYSSKSINKTDKNNFDIINDDWNFCILICKFQSSFIISKANT